MNRTMDGSCLHGRTCVTEHVDLENEFGHNVSVVPILASNQGGSYL